MSAAPATDTETRAAGTFSQSTRPSGAHHTICLLQPSRHDSTRFYKDYASISECIEGLLQMYEIRLREFNPTSASITYDYNSLCQFLDDMKEVCILSWDNSISGYKRYDRGWAKSALQDHLANLVQTGGGGGAGSSRR